MKVLSASLESLQECHKLLKIAHRQWNVSILSDNDYAIIKANLKRASAQLVGIRATMGMATLQASIKAIETKLFDAKYRTKNTQVPHLKFTAVLDCISRVSLELKQMFAQTPRSLSQLRTPLPSLSKTSTLPQYHSTISRSVRSVVMDAPLAPTSATVRAPVKPNQ